MQSNPKRTLEEEDKETPSKRLHIDSQSLSANDPISPPPLDNSKASPEVSDSHSIKNDADSTTTYSAPPTSTIAEQPSSKSRDIKMRALINTKEAGIIIGKNGSNIAEIKGESGVKVLVTPFVQGAPDRVMTFIGPLHGLGKAISMIVDKLISKAKIHDPTIFEATIRMLIPTSRMGYVIGKAGSRVKELQQESGAKIYSDEDELPNSTERIMTLIGDKESLSIACHSLAEIIGDHHERKDFPSMIYFDPTVKQNIRPRSPSPPLSYNAPLPMSNLTAAQATAALYAYYPQLQLLAQYPQLQQQYLQQLAQAANPNTSAFEQKIPPPTSLQQQLQQLYNQPVLATPMVTPTTSSLSSGQQTKEITIPNNIVGAIIGKKGASINEIRKSSRCQIKLDDGEDGAFERKIWLTGTPVDILNAERALKRRVEEEQHKHGLK